MPRTDVAVDGSHWLIDGRPPHAGRPAEGLLMNVRMVNAFFEDAGPAADAHLGTFDPDENTARFVARMPDYPAQGVTAFTIGLQGGAPGYEGAVNSAFDRDGSLRRAYMARVARIVEAADRLGAVVILSAFYQRQHSHERALTGRAAAMNAAANVARWVTARRYTNVVLEISNEYRHDGFSRWPDGDWLRSPAGQVELIRHVKAVAPRLLVSTSGTGDGTIHAAIGEAADFILLHLNNTPLDRIPAVISAARLAVAGGAGWGFMHSEKNQYVPFEYVGADDDPVVYAMVRRLTTADATYVPAPDAAGGWREAADPGEMRRVAGMNRAQLDEAFEFIQGHTKNGGLLVVRRGWLVYEAYFGRGHREATANLGSAGKSFTSVAVGMLMADRPDLFPDGLDQKVLTPAYFPPEAFPLADARMADVSLGQLLAFTACVRGNNPAYVRGEPVTLDPAGPDGWPAMVDAVALGREDAEQSGASVSARTLWCEPGGGYSYATSSIHLASMIVRHVAGRELEDFLRDRLAAPLGWGRWGYGYRHADRLTHTPGGGGIVLRPTDVLRFGYLLLHDGRWASDQLVPAWYVQHATRRSPYNPPLSLQPAVRRQHRRRRAGSAARRVLEAGIGGTCAVCRALARSRRVEARRPGRAVRAARHGHGDSS
jgi:CubicO group peptidase (beta-lactamase class C family)